MEPNEEMPLTGQCVCACYKAAAFAAAAAEAILSGDARGAITLLNFFRPLLHLPAYHLRGRSVCAIFLSTRDYSDFLLARRYASLVLAMTLCLSVTSRSSIDIYIWFISHKDAARRSIDGSNWFSARRLPSIYLTLRYKKIQESTKLYFFLELCHKLWT